MPARNYLYLFIAVLLVLPLLLAGCGQEQVTTVPVAVSAGPAVTPSRSPSASPSPAAISQEWESRWLKGIPCNAPCWEGITPGKTTSSEAITLLKQNPLIGKVWVDSPGSHSHQSTISWLAVQTANNSSNDSLPRGELTFRSSSPSQVISGIKLFLNKGFKLSEVMQTYGNPSHVLARYLQLPDYGGPDYPVTIIFESRGIALMNSSVVLKDQPVDGNRSFDFIIFFVPGIEGLYEAWFGDLDRYGYTELVPWQGFKDFQFYCRNVGGGSC